MSRVSHVPPANIAEPYPTGTKRMKRCAHEQVVVCLSTRRFTDTPGCKLILEVSRVCEPHRTVVAVARINALVVYGGGSHQSRSVDQSTGRKLDTFPSGSFARLVKKKLLEHLSIINILITAHFSFVD